MKPPWAHLIIACGFCALACVEQTDDGRRTFTLPSRENFAAVSAVLEPRCGTLDCHGGPARNLRIFGVHGLRVDGNDVTGGTDTTDLEIAATYASVVELDPEVLSRIHAEGGRGAEDWIVLSKGRGREHHVGGVRLPEGGPADRCVISWISGQTNVSACVADEFGPVPREGEEW